MGVFVCILGFCIPGMDSFEGGLDPENSRNSAMIISIVALNFHSTAFTNCNSRGNCSVA